MATTSVSIEPGPSRAAPEPPAPAGLRATDASVGRAWVLNGGLWFGLCAFAWGAWVISGDFKQNTIGRSLAPDWYVTLVRCVEVFGLLVTLAILWYFVVRPKLRTGRLSFDGLFFLGCWMLFIQEPWINYTSLQFLYSTTFVNFGSWLRWIPGWSSPHPQLEPVALVWGTAYLWLVAIPGWAGSRFMTRARSRRPDIGVFRLVGTTFAAFVVFDLLLETFIVRTQLFSYGATVPSLTLFAGHKYQFPLYETVSWCATYTGLACLHHFRDDRGRSLVERGIDKLKVRGRLKTFARFLAIMGACQLVMLVTYNIPYQFWALHAGPMPQTLVNEPWRTAGVCGPRTSYDCPTPKDPIARQSSPTNRIDPRLAKPR
jgi:hypothetical protein